MSTSVAAARANRRAHGRWLGIAGLLAVLVIWSYWPTLTALREFWAVNDDYSVGMLVPPVALYLAWRERQALRAAAVRPDAWGLALVLASQLMRFGGLYYDFGSAERLSLIVLVSGLLLLTAGREVFRRLIWVQAFLFLMVPLPHRIHYAVALPLQEWATSFAVVGLETLGYYVTRDGNVLRLDEHRAVMVAEACSGLRMLTAFVFTAAALCFLIRRPVWQKVALVLSSLPIAVCSNALRILVTSAWVHAAADIGVEQRLHDLAGLLMMPLALLVLLAEMRFLARVTTVAPEPRPAAVRAAAHRRVSSQRG